MGAKKPVDSRLRVLMICTVPMIEGDGIMTVMLNYAEHMDRDDVSIDFLACNDAVPAIRERIAEMGGRLYVVEGRIRRPVHYARAVARIVRENGYDVVHAHGNSRTLAAEMVAARLGGARVRCAHSHNTKGSFPVLNWLLRPIFNQSYTHGFACGVSAGKWLFGNHSFTVLNNGLDVEKYRFDRAQREEYREKLGIGDRVAISHVGRFCEQKNHPFLIDAFEHALCRDPNRLLVLAGDGPTRPAIEEAVRQRGLSDHVIFLGIVRDIPRLLSAMDVMVLPSLYEGLPNVLVECQAAGMPALVSDAVTRDCDMTGRVTFLPLESDAWAGAMARAARAEGPDREAACALGAERLRAGGYDIRAEARRLGALYADAAKKYIPERETR